MGYHVLFGKIAHGNRDFEGMDFNNPKRTGMSVEVEKYFSQSKIDGPVCLLVGDRRPHRRVDQGNELRSQQSDLASFFIDTKETREHWARYLTD